MLTARDAAIDFIKPYVLRGDSLESLMSGYMGHAGAGGWFSIGGYLNGKNIGRNKILIKELHHKTVNEVFSLTELYNEIKRGQTMVKTFVQKKPEQ